MPAKKTGPSQLDDPYTQAGVAQVVGITQQNIAALAKVGVFEGAKTVREGVLRYCARQRAYASKNEGGLSDERAKLAKAQRDRIEMENAARRGELAPITVLRDTLAAMATACVAHIDAVPGKARQRMPHLSARDLATLDALLKEARNAMAATRPAPAPKTRGRRAAV